MVFAILAWTPTLKRCWLCGPSLLQGWAHVWNILIAGFRTFCSNVCMRGSKINNCWFGAQSVCTMWGSSLSVTCNHFYFQNYTHFVPFDRQFLRSSRPSIPTCTAWAFWCATSRVMKLWGKRWLWQSTITSSPTSLSSTKSARGGNNTSFACLCVKDCRHDRGW